MESDLNDALSQNPAELETHHLKAVGLCCQGKFKEANEQFSFLTALLQNNYKLTYNYGLQELLFF
jgi:Tfp pilus assembly protein PilF